MKQPVLFLTQSSSNLLGQLAGYLAKQSTIFHQVRSLTTQPTASFVINYYSIHILCSILPKPLPFGPSPLRLRPATFGSPNPYFPRRVLLLLPVVSSESAGPLRPPEQFEGSDVVGARARFLLLTSCLPPVSTLLVLALGPPAPACSRPTPA